MDSISTVKAIAAGASLLPLLQAAPWAGEIAAVFHRSILCTAPNHRLLHLHTGPQLVSPFSLRIEADWATVFAEAPPVQGMPVRKIGSALDIAEHIHLSLHEVTSYQSPSCLMSDIEPAAVRTAWQVLRAHGRVSGLDKLPGIQRIVIAMHQALVGGNSAPMLEAARRLIGLGPGLTPSGDDFLVGCLRGLWLMCWNEPAACQTLNRLRDALLPNLETRTTRVSAEFIRYALGGAFAEVLDLAALSLLARSRPQVVRSAVGRLLAQGETSGSDTTLGLLTCVGALLSTPDGEPRREWHAAPSTPSASAATRG
jgi:hypothetical protein